MLLVHTGLGDVPGKTWGWLGLTIIDLDWTEGMGDMFEHAVAHEVGHYKSFFANTIVDPEVLHKIVQQVPLRNLLSDGDAAGYAAEVSQFGSVYGGNQ